MKEKPSGRDALHRCCRSRTRRPIFCGGACARARRHHSKRVSSSRWTRATCTERLGRARARCHASLGEYDGIVVVTNRHDAYTARARALSRTAPKPVVLTGSQRPLAEARTDALREPRRRGDRRDARRTEVCVTFASRVCAACGRRSAMRGARRVRLAELRPIRGDGDARRGGRSRAKARAVGRSMIASSPACSVRVFPGLESDSSRARCARP